MAGSLHRLRRGGTFVALVALIIGISMSPAAAIAVGPDAVDDSFTFSKAVAFDALANDTASTGVPSVVSTTAPAHGTASCGPLGGCLYTAAEGYTGADSFTYTISDANGTDTATVNLTVQAATVGNLSAIDDNLAVRAGTAGTVDVLANDVGGTGTKTVTNATDPPHGTASCTSAGSCTYTPDPGYSGGDGFIYTVSASSATATATVHVTVAPANASFALVGSGTPTATGGAWKVGADPSNVPQEAAGVVGVPSVTASPEAPQAIDGSSVTNAPGWPGTGSSSSITASATNRALAGDSITALFPPPLPPITQGTGGDGHVPILVGTRVYAIYHHTPQTSISCIDRLTGVLCPGYPIQTNFSTGDAPGPAVVQGTRFWTHLYARDSYSQTASIGLFCWDTLTNSTCGLTVVDRAVTTQNPATSAPHLVNGKMWFGGETGKLYCVDPATGAPCGAIDTSLGRGFSSDTWSSGGGYDAVNHGSRLYLLDMKSPRKVACIDVAAGGACAGWSSPLTIGNGQNLLNRYDTTGNVVGVCVTESSSLKCVNDGDPATITTYTGWFASPYEAYDATVEAETGSRTLYGQLSAAGLACFDWTTQAACTGGSYSGGRITVDRNSSGLPDAYGAVFDGACVVAVGDRAQVFTVDPAGSSPCTSLATGSAGQLVDLRAQRCDNTVGAATWGRLAILDANLDASTGDFTSLVVTVKDGATGAVLVSGQLVGTDGTLNLSGIDPNAHPSLTIGANADARSSSQAWAAGNWPKANISWNADPAAICFKTTQPPPCPTANPVAVVNAAFIGGSQTKRLAVTTTDCPAPRGDEPVGAPKRNGYTLIAADGGTFSFGLPFLGTRSVRASAVQAPSGAVLNAPLVGAAVTPSQNGYWQAAADGGVFAFGDAAFLGSMGGQPLNRPIVGMASNGKGGYWLVASDGGIFSFGNAEFFGSTGDLRLNKPIVGMASTPTGLGYWLVASDGGIFSFGDAVFSGSTGDVRLNKPIVGMASSPAGGYWLVASDGGVFTFGSAGFFGSASGQSLNSPVTGIAATPTGLGYTITSQDGGIFNYGDSPYIGSATELGLKAPIVAIISI